MNARPRSRTSPRQVARRAAVQGLSIKNRLAHRPQRFFDEPGSTILLLHNTHPRQLAALQRYVDTHRQLFTSFGDALPSAPNPRGIALTFDDGFLSNLSAARMLALRDVYACFYVPTDVIGLSKDNSDAFFRRPQTEGVMGWREIEQIRALGHTIGSHARQHLPLTEWTLPQAEDQVKGSIVVLRERLGSVDQFAWPFGGLQYAPVADLVRWCREIDVIPASGRRGKNTPTRFASEGYLRRDAVDLNWLSADLAALVAAR